MNINQFDRAMRRRSRYAWMRRNAWWIATVAAVLSALSLLQ